MGQKARPIGLRLGINKTWNSRWYAANDEYSKFLHEDYAITAYVEKELKQAGIARVIIERPAKSLMKLTLEVASPARVIGRKGSDIEKLKSKLSKLVSKDVSINIVEVRKPEIHAKLVAQTIADNLERRVAPKRAMKKAVETAMRMGVKGIRVNCSGRLGGAEIARMEWYRRGRVPLHTLRADIDYGVAEALTTYGIIGVKVWIYHGDIMEHDPRAQDKKLKEHQMKRS